MSEQGSELGWIALHAQQLSESLVRLSAEVAEVSRELVRTRTQMTESAATASRHQRSLVRWTAVLSFATLAYVVAAFLPLFVRPAATSRTSEAAWVLWMELPNGSGRWSLANSGELAFEKKSECERIKQAAYKTRVLVADEAAKRGEKVPAAFFTCLPDTVDPRGPKGAPR